MTYFFLTLVLSHCFLLCVYVKFLLAPALNTTRFFPGLPLPCSVVLDKTLRGLGIDDTRENLEGLWQSRALAGLGGGGGDLNFGSIG